MGASCRENTLQQRLQEGPALQRQWLRTLARQGDAMPYFSLKDAGA
jgi:hypothetical protein